MLKARLLGPDWPCHLPWVLLGLRAAPREDSGLSAAKLVFGALMNLPAEVVSGNRPPESIVKEISSFLPCMAPLQLPLPSPPTAALMKAAYIYVRSLPAAPALTTAYRGPYPVMECGPKHFKIAVGTQVDQVSVDNLKHHHGSMVIAAEPQKCRWPRQLHPYWSFPCPGAETEGGPVETILQKFLS
jgi:hypothetical protein